MEFHNQINTNQKKKDEAQNEDETCIYHYYVQKYKVELAEQLKLYEELKRHRDAAEAKVKSDEQNPPPRLYMNHFERRLMDWHIANLEYANATSINDLSMKHWDQVTCNYSKFSFQKIPLFSTSFLGYTKLSSGFLAVGHKNAQYTSVTHGQKTGWKFGIS